MGIRAKRAREMTPPFGQSYKRPWARILEARGGVMTIFPVLGAITGFVLGLYFTVFILIPATLIVAAVTMVIGHLSNHAFSFMLLATLGTAASLQIGFFVGSVLHARLSTRKNEDAMDGVSGKFDI
jgi:membrane protein DedA with SNARE-associated domain